MAKRAKQQLEDNGGGVTETPEVSEPQQPLQRFSYAVGKDAYVTASVWDRLVQLEGGDSFTTYDVSVQKRVKVNGEWKTLHSFRAYELAVVQHAVGRAFDFILETRAAKDGIPF